MYLLLLRWCLQLSLNKPLQCYLRLAGDLSLLVRSILSYLTSGAILLEIKHNKATKFILKLVLKAMQLLKSKGELGTLRDILWSKFIFRYPLLVLKFAQ